MEQRQKKAYRPGLGTTTAAMYIAWTLAGIAVLVLLGDAAVFAGLLLVAAAILQAGAMITEAIYRTRQ